MIRAKKIIFFKYCFCFSWDNGENHLLFNVLPRENGITELKTDHAMIAGADFDAWSYRTGFDFSIPFLGFDRDDSMISNLYNER